MAQPYTLETLSNQLNSAAQNSGAALPAEIKGALSSFISHYMFRLLWIGLIFVVFTFVFYGAFLYFTAYGDENRALQAKKTITYAFIGLVIGAVAMGAATYINNILVSNQTQQQQQLQAPTTQISVQDRHRQAAKQALENLGYNADPALIEQVAQEIITVVNGTTDQLTIEQLIKDMRLDGKIRSAP